MSSLTSLWLPEASLLRQSRLATIEKLPDLARQYFQHSIAADAPVVSAVRLQMTGEIKLKTWMPFTATQVVRTNAGFVWSARVRSGITYISGSDQFLNGAGEMKWKLFGMIPVMTGVGPEISRSAKDRFAIERIFLPPSLFTDESNWTQDADTISVKSLGLCDIKLGVRPPGVIESVSMERWGNPNGSTFERLPFGGVVEEEKTWSGFTIPSRLRVGWYFGSDRFASEGEFFRAKITHAEFR